MKFKRITVNPVLNMMNNGMRSMYSAISNLKIYQIGIILFLLVMIFGYLDYRIQGEGIYNDGQSAFAALPKGMDFKAVHSYGLALRSSFVDYLNAPNVYPPLVTILYLPLTFFSANIAYQVFSIVLLCFLFANVYALLSEKDSVNLRYNATRSSKALISLVVVSLLFHTYPVNFAIERGNSDIIAAAFAAFSLLAMSRGSLIFSTALLAISTELKVYPAILVVLLLARFGWKGLLYFGFFTVAPLFILGVSGLEKFISSLFAFSNTPFLWTGNHSLLSFLAAIAKAAIAKTWIVDTLSDLKSKMALYFTLSMLPFIGVLAVVVYRYVRSTKKLRANILAGSRLCHFSGMEVGIIGICFCLMSLIPSVSHDYKLVIHVVPLILLFSRSWEELFYSKKTAFVVTVIISVAVAYLFIPRYTVLPLHLLFGLTSPVTEMKTPAILIAFLCYAYLALIGNSETIANDKISRDDS